MAEAVNSGLNFPGREPYEILTISAPSEDISNLKLKDCNRTDIQSKVDESCRKLVNVAREALQKHNNLKKVILLEHPPRFDDKLKSEMAIFANKTLCKLIDDSKSDQIELGKHTLQCYGIGKTFEARYRNSITKQLDGLHFFGPLGSKVLSESLIEILVTSSQKSVTMAPSTPQADTLLLPNIQVSNRFEVLDQGNE